MHPGRDLPRGRRGSGLAADGGCGRDRGVRRSRPRAARRRRPASSATASSRRPGLEVRVLVRARAGDFVHSPQEVDVMVADIEAIAGRRPGRHAARLRHRARSTPDGNVDADAVRRLVAACGDAPVTFHKAFDSVPDQPVGARRCWPTSGVTRVLTSGGGGPALDHLPAARRPGAAGRRRRTDRGRRRRAARQRRPHRGRDRRARGAPACARAAVASAGVVRAATTTGRRSVTSAAVVAEVMAALGQVPERTPVSPGNSTAPASGSTPDTSSSGNIGRWIRRCPSRARSWSTPPGVSASIQSAARSNSSGSR